jgi:phosphoheptose isomerase
VKERARQVVTANVADAKAMLQQLLELEAQIEAASAVIAEALLSGYKLLACGNGGSAADASHLTTEFVVRFDRERRAYPAISLSSHGGDLTAIGNDYSFAERKTSS